MKIAVFFHIYYKDSVNELKAYLSGFKEYDSRFYFNVPISDFGQHIIIANDIKSIYPNAIIVFSTNRGKDIGGKLTLLNYYLASGYNADYMVFLHDKKSEVSYKINNEDVNAVKWRQDLYSIIEPNNISKIIKLFADNKVAMVASKQHLYNIKEHGKDVVISHNNNSLKKLSNEMQLKNFEQDNLTFVGGTMFWVRASVYESFFKQNNPLQIREKLEKGSFTDRFTGTYSHAMERIFSWLVTDKKFIIEGI